MARYMTGYDEDSAMSNMNYPSMESSSESKLRSGATSRESYSEQKLRKNAKPMVKAKAKPKAKPVVGRAGAQTPGQRAKLGPAKSADAARASARSKPKSSSTGGYPRPTAKTTSTGAKSSGMTKKNFGSRLADAVTGKGKPTSSARAAEQAKLKKAWDIAMAKKKGK